MKIKARTVIFFLALGVGTLGAFGAPNVAHASDKDLLCERHPTAYLVAEIESENSDPCAATAKIQAIAYECGLPENTSAFIQNSLEDNIKVAQTKCDSYCASISPKCSGYMDHPAVCGSRTPANRAVDVGKNVIHCPDHCKGQAFNYCSIYWGNFFSADPSLFKKSKPNCHCRKK